MALFLNRHSKGFVLGKSSAFVLQDLQLYFRPCAPRTSVRREGLF